MRRTGIPLLLLIFLAAGCGPKKGPDLPKPMEASGKITLPDGEPLPGGRVELKPANAKGASVEAFADVDPDGSFKLMSYKPGDGAVPGSYKVTISPFDYRSKTGSPTKVAFANRIPAKYLEASSSDLTVEIKQGLNKLDLRLTP
jgi:hypothetical protein